MSRGLRRGPAGWDAALLLPLVALCVLPAYPPLEWSWNAWLGLAPTAALLRHGRADLGRVALGALAWGLVFYGTQLWWVLEALMHLAGQPWWMAGGLLALLLLALAPFPAAALWLARAGWVRLGLSPLWSLPPLWAAQEAVLGRVPFGGIPWGALSATQTGGLLTPLVVPALGGAGLTWLVVGTGCLWVWALHRMLGGPAPHRVLRRWRPAAWVLPAALTLLGLLPGSLRGPGGQVPDATPAFEAVLVQDARSVPRLAAQQDDPTQVRPLLERSLTGLLTADPAMPTGLPRLIVWPESAYSGLVERGETLADLGRFAAALEAALLLGSDARPLLPGGQPLGQDTNAAYLVQGLPFDFWRYDKRSLVPFGEYVPAGFRWLLPRKVTVGETDYAAGRAPPVLDWAPAPGRPPLRLGLAICFESTLPAHSRQAVRTGAGVLVVLANDAWLSPGAALQHLRLSTLRAMEAGRPLLFVANGGWLAALDPSGYGPTRPPGRSVLRVPVQLARVETPFVRWGPWPLALLFAGQLLLAWGWGRERR